MNRVRSCLHSACTTSLAIRSWGSRALGDLRDPHAKTCWTSLLDQELPYLYLRIEFVESCIPYLDDLILQASSRAGHLNIPRSLIHLQNRLVSLEYCLEKSGQVCAYLSLYACNCIFTVLHSYRRTAIARQHAFRTNQLQASLLQRMET